ncbi:Uu.00g136650.m01.CDS01 [Anthostomella pinea]|uniref:Uu.00g136650.m01.CDS01 n=1 Tax=Anthostomella pinea TaxID=933095 RepID=A0AAI8VPF4_9PEZI|nr:Uu.00g136650.m01.CDS01 [Anthostomella pinea]
MPHQVPVKASTPTPAADKGPASDNWFGMPSEEEQMELLRQEGFWNEVKTKNKGKKNDGSADNTTSAAPANGGDNATPSASINMRCDIRFSDVTVSMANEEQGVTYLLVGNLPRTGSGVFGCNVEPVPPAPEEASAEGIKRLLSK